MAREQLRRTAEIADQIGPETDIPAPDVGTSPQVMAWIFDTYSMNKGHSVLGVVTGKPLTIGGSLGREEATARGGLFCIRDAAAKRDRSLAGMRAAVQGFGNVGSYLAKFLHEEGAIVVGISDSTVGLHNPKGIDVPAAFAHKREHRTLAGLKDAEALANAGGVVVSYFEWVQGLQEYFWKESEVNAKLNDIVSRAFEETWETAQRRDVPMRMAAYGLAVQRVAEATITRGIY